MSLRIFQAEAKMAVKKLPPPLTTFKRHPIKWLKIKGITTVDALVFVHIGTLIVVGLYYLLTQTYHPITQGWHELIPQKYQRNMVRDVGEGLLGGYLAQLIVWNHFKIKTKKVHIIDKIEHALHIPNLKYPERLTGKQFAAALLLGIIYAVPGFLVSLLVVKWAHIHVRPEHLHSYGSKVQAIFTGSYDKKIIGLASSIFLGRRPMKKVYDDTQLWFAEHRLVVLHKPLHFYHAPTFQARYNDLKQRNWGIRLPDNLKGDHKDLTATLMTGAVIGGVALAGFGYWVITVKA